MNIETRFAKRMQSIFSATGQIINDFYLEIGIYCIGLLNASLVAWSIYTDLVANDQPLLYAITLGVIALVAVEGLAVYLVGAAARTNNSWLWFFSVIFATFFTFAHYQVAHNNAHISGYVTYAIPFFVVIGYWARTLKVQIESSQVDRAQLEREELERKRRIEDEERHQKMEIERLKLEQKQAQKMAQIEGQLQAQKEQKQAQNSQMISSLNRANQSRQDKILNRQNAIIDLMETSSNIGPTELTRQLNELGHETSVSTVKRDLRVLNGRVQK